MEGEVGKERERWCEVEGIRERARERERDREGEGEREKRERETFTRWNSEHDGGEI